MAATPTRSAMLMVAALVSGCASVPPEDSPAMSLLKAANQVPVLPEDAPDARLPPGTNVNPIPLEPAIPVLKGAKAIAQANRQAVQEVTSELFRGAKLVFQVVEGGRYPIRVPRDGKTTITFLPDEDFFDMVMPDKPQVFEVTDSATGSSVGLRDAIVVKCHSNAILPGVSATDQIIYISTKREYILDLACQKNGNILVGFENPASGLRSDMGGGNPRPPRARTISGGAALENLDCRYGVTGGVLNLRGEQVSVCTDGRQTIVTFPTPREAGGSVPMPVIFADPPPNAVAHTNPVTGARSWVADRPLATFELRYGDEAIQAVRRGG